MRHKLSPSPPQNARALPSLHKSCLCRASPCSRVQRAVLLNITSKSSLSRDRNNEYSQQKFKSSAGGFPWRDLDRALSASLCSVKSFDIRVVRIYSVWLLSPTYILALPIQLTCPLPCPYRQHRHPSTLRPSRLDECICSKPTARWFPDYFCVRCCDVIIC